MDKEFRVKFLGGKRGLGRFKGTIHISHIKGQLTVAGDPQVSFEPPSELVITAPVRLLGGRSTVTMDLDWKPAFLVSAVCRGFRFNETLAGEILPFGHELTTNIRYAIRDSAIIGWPSVQRDTFRFAADLSPASWDKVRGALGEQDRFSRCGIAMNADSVLVKLKELTSRGIKVRLPPRIFKPFQLPVVLDGFFSAGDYRVEARAFDPAIAVRPEYMRLAFRTNLRVIATPDTVREAPAMVPAVRPDSAPARQ